MRDEPIRVICYAGGREEERPRAFLRGGARVDIERIIRAWIGEEGETRERRRFFQVRAADGKFYLLSFDESLGTWFLSSGDPAAR
jgi:hypothetical protein